MVAGKICPAVKNPVSIRIRQVHVVTLLQGDGVAACQPNLTAIIPHISVEVDALARGLRGGQAPLHARPPGAVVGHWK